MRLTLIAATALMTVLVTQQACAKEPSREPSREPSSETARVAAAPERLAERDDTRPQPIVGAPAAAGDCSRDPQAALAGAVAKTLSAVRGNDFETFLSLIGPDGVDINGTVTPDNLAKQFASKTGRFCDLFTCGGKPGDMHAKFHDGPTDTQYDAKNKRASVFVNANTNDELDLSFKWGASCRWELTAIAVP